MVSPPATTRHEGLNHHTKDLPSPVPTVQACKPASGNYVRQLRDGRRAKKSVLPSRATRTPYRLERSRYEASQLTSVLRFLRRALVSHVLHQGGLIRRILPRPPEPPPHHGVPACSQPTSKTVQRVAVSPSERTKHHPPRTLCTAARYH